MSNFSRRPEQPEPWNSEVVPVIPEWVKDWWLLLLVPALAALGAMVDVGHVYGAGYGWVLLVIAVCATGALSWQGYSRRIEAAEVHREQALYELHEMAKADAMAWRDFENYCGDLLRAGGYRDVLVIGSTVHDKGVDVTATAPDGTPVAVQCKHRKGRVGPDVIRDLAGAINAGKHHGRTGIVMTNAQATSGAHADAKDHRITVIDRPVLQQWMSQARSQTEQRGRAPGTPGSAQPPLMRPAAKFTAAILGAGFIVLIVIALEHPAPRMPAKATTSRPQPAASVVSGPSTVVREAFTAINRHDWRTLCKLWPHPDSGHGCSYRKMIAGYRMTSRDVVTSLKVSDDVVSARVLAYETTGTFQTYEFSYKVHAGKIIWGHSVLLATSYPRRKAPSELVHPPTLAALNVR